MSQIMNLKHELKINSSILPAHKKCPFSELFWSVFSHIWTEYAEILRTSPYSVRMRENTDQNNSEYGHFSRSVHYQSELKINQNKEV